MEPQNKAIVVAGLPDEVAKLLEAELPQVTVHSVAGGEQALEQVRHHSYALLIVDDGARGTPASEVVRQVRASPGTAELPVLCCFRNGCGSEAKALLADRRTRLMFSAEPEQVVRLAASLLGLDPKPGSKEQNVREAVARLFQRFQDTFRVQLRQVESAVLALSEGRLTSELRLSGYFDAHKLAGSLGTFGYPRGSELAREIAGLLRGEAPLENESARLSKLVAELRRELDRPPADSVA